jgi:hypothetical protein
MSCVRRARSRDRRRRICAYSRYVETPRHLIIELNADGSDYLVCTGATSAPLAKNWPEVQDILAHECKKLTVQDILQRMPEEQRPDRTTLWRCLKRAAKQGLVCYEGSGLGSGGQRYWLREREPLLRPSEGASKAEWQAWNDRWLRSVFGEEPASA